MPFDTQEDLLPEATSLTTSDFWRIVKDTGGGAMSSQIIKPFAINTSWVPGWTNVTIGNATVAAKYVRAGGLVVFRLNVTFGSTTSVSGNISFSLPVTAESVSLATPIGILRMLDSSASAAYGGAIQQTVGGVCQLVVYDASATYLNGGTAINATIPFTWATGDTIACSGTYLAST